MPHSKIIIRVDGGPQIGMGHIMRCLRLGAHIVKEHPADITFVTSTPRFFNNLLEQYIPDAQIAKFDDNNLEDILEFYDYFAPHVVISDLNLGRDIDDYITYVRNVPYHVNLAEPHLNHFPFGLVVFPSILPVKPKCACETRAEYLIGAGYLLIDPELSKLAPVVIDKAKPLNILITPGGADPSGATEKIIDILKSSVFDYPLIYFNLVLGHAKPGSEELIESAKGIDNLVLIEPQSDLIDLISDSHIVITSGGTTAYEAIAAGRPTWIIPQIEFEQEIAKILHKKNATLGFGISSMKSELLDRLPIIHDNPETLQPVIDAGRKLIDGKGIKRVAAKIIDSLRAMKI